VYDRARIVEATEDASIHHCNVTQRLEELIDDPWENENLFDLLRWELSGNPVGQRFISMLRRRLGEDRFWEFMEEDDFLELDPRVNVLRLDAPGQLLFPFAAANAA
jgi:hypothetical protein